MLLERLIEVFSLGVKNLMRNKLRSFLTMLGMIFGVGSVIAMLAVGAGARHEILARIQELGVKNIIVNSVRPPQETKPDNAQNWVDEYGLKFRDESILRDTVPSVEAILPVNLVKEGVRHGSRQVEAAVLGVTPEHLRMFRLDVRRGRTFNHVDSAAAKNVCIVRGGLVRALETTDDPIGMTVHIGRHPYEIIGVLADEEFRSHTRQALALDERAQEVYIPYTSSMRDYGTWTYVNRGGQEERSRVELDQMIVVAKSDFAVEPTSRVIQTVLERFHKKKDYEIVVPMELLKQSENTQRVFNIVMVLIAAISLVVGGIGIANIMLATITERTKEIGVRRALGARRSDIMTQFLTETAAIGIVGGILGCAFGIAAIQGITHFTNWQALVAPHYVFISLGISCAVAIISGIFPARRASRMDPITALRYE
jgi:putative ABC transport system permease protein